MSKYFADSRNPGNNVSQTQQARGPVIQAKFQVLANGNLTEMKHANADSP